MPCQPLANAFDHIGRLHGLEQGCEIAAQCPHARRKLVHGVMAGGSHTKPAIALLARIGCMRIDKWLWAARFFKTRAMAAKACELGRVRSQGVEAKPAREVRVGNMLQVKTEGGDFEVEVLALSEIRGPAAAAQTLYLETEASKEARLRTAEERRAMQQYAPIPERRPSKRDRRRIIQFRSGR